MRPAGAAIPAGTKEHPQDQPRHRPASIPAREVTPGEYRRPGLGQRGDGHGPRRAGLPGRRRSHRDGGRDPGAVPADAGAGPCDGHRGSDLRAGRVHRRAGVFRRRGLQPAGVADQPDRRHNQGRCGGVYRVGPAGGGASGGRGGAGGWSPGIFVDIFIMLLLVPDCQIGAHNLLGLSCRADVVSGRDCNIARCSRTRRS